uniref:Ig-like domain-containing protein n=1 Tax=Tetraodon nigroviridis TaxID=99883 RepID=H3CHP6_TETNG
MNSLVFLLLLALKSVPNCFAVTHTLNYFHTVSSGVPNFPEFVAVVMVDDVHISHYDSNTRRTQPRQEWMENVNADDPQYWEGETGNFMGAHQAYKARIEILKPRFNQTGAGVHTYQLMYGCEWDDETDEINGFNQYGYDAEDFISFKLKEEIWVAAKREAEITKRKCDQNRANTDYLKSYYTQICIKWLQKFVDYGRSSLMRTELPSVSLLQKEPSSPVTCMATGFYPDGATLSWRRGEEELHEEVEPGEILPNPDGTFQMSAALDLSSVPPEDWSSYKCVFQLSGGQEVPTSLDRKRNRTNWEVWVVFSPPENPSITTAIVGVAVAVLVLVLGAIAGFIVYRQKKGKCPRAEGHPEVKEPLKPAA